MPSGSPRVHRTQCWKSLRFLTCIALTQRSPLVRSPGVGGRGEAGNLPLRLPMRFPMGNWMGELAQRFCCYSGLICWGPQSVALRSHCLARGETKRDKLRLRPLWHWFGTTIGERTLRQTKPFVAHGALAQDRSFLIAQAWLWRRPKRYVSLPTTRSWPDQDPQCPFHPDEFPQPDSPLQTVGSHHWCWCSVQDVVPQFWLRPCYWGWSGHGLLRVHMWRPLELASILLELTALGAGLLQVGRRGGRPCRTLDLSIR